LTVGDARLGPIMGTNATAASVRDFEPNKITLPATGDVVVRIGQKGLDRALESSRK
jgi:hypothetical protein